MALTPIQISGFPPAGALNPTDEVPVSQGGVTARTTVSAFTASVGGVPEAPNDGVPYARESLGWVATITSSTRNAYSKIQYAAATVVSSATGTYTPDCTAISNSLFLTLTGNLTLAAPTSAIAGMVLNILLYEDATGGRTITLNSVFKFGGGVTPTWVTTASARNLLSCVFDGTNWICGAVVGAA